MNAAHEPIRTVLVDDHALVRRGFMRILEDAPDIVVVGEAGGGEEAVALVRQLGPSVVVMDCAMPGTDGLTATRRIREFAPEIGILMLSMHGEDTWVRQALDAGATGYLLKNVMDLDLVNAIRSVARGERTLDPQVARSEAMRGERADALSARELEVLRLIVEGMSTRECAAELGLSVNTVAVHRANIMDRLGIHKTAQLVVYAIRHGLARLP
jgi:DNA-binding NarL/FixJ family response regulator